MPVKVTWTNEAREDLLRIYVLIGLEQPAAAERYYDHIDAKARLLAERRVKTKILSKIAFLSKRNLL